MALSEGTVFSSEASVELCVLTLPVSTGLYLVLHQKLLLHDKFRIFFRCKCPSSRNAVGVTIRQGYHLQRQANHWLMRSFKCSWNTVKAHYFRHHWLPDYQIFCKRIDPKLFIPTNLSSYPSLTNKNSSMRTDTTYIVIDL